MQKIRQSARKKKGTKADSAKNSMFATLFDRRK